MRGIKKSLEIVLKAFLTSKETSIWVGCESRSADTAWWAISVPLRQQTPIPGRAMVTRQSESVVWRRTIEPWGVGREQQTSR